MMILEGTTKNNDAQSLVIFAQNTELPTVISNTIGMILVSALFFPNRQTHLKMCNEL